MPQHSAVPTESPTLLVPFGIFRPQEWFLGVLGPWPALLVLSPREEASADHPSLWLSGTRSAQRFRCTLFCELPEATLHDHKRTLWRLVSVHIILTGHEHGRATTTFDMVKRTTRARESSRGGSVVGVD